MTIQSVTSVTAAQQSPLLTLSSLSSSPAASGTTGSAAPGSAGFMDTVQQFLNQVNTEYQSTDVAISDILTGKSDNVHSVVLAAARSDLSFRMLMEMRNRLMESYQEIMRMQL